ncbi:MAG: aspartate-semialdehyde dehydrogenase [Acidobacteriota bacterium]
MASGFVKVGATKASFEADGKMPVAVLGATGAVGQRMVQGLGGHPWFKVASVVASERSAGKRYAEAVRWLLPTPIPADVADLVVAPVDSEYPGRVAFSALDADVAGPLEEAAARRGLLVVSNARNHRMVPDVPLLVPEINADHLRLLEHQKQRFPSGGAIVTNPNCSTVGLAMALAPLQRSFGIEAVHVTTLQALSGAGYPGVASFDLMDNVIPHIGGEEGKLETEPLKILGTLADGAESVAPATFPISASVHRVPVLDGHLESVAVRLARPASIPEIAEALASFTGEPQRLGLPTAPGKPIVVLPGEDRPQPRKDRDLGHGMTVSIGRIREDKVLGIKMSVLVHNTIRGAAGAAILNAELILAGLRQKAVR